MSDETVRDVCWEMRSMGNYQSYSGDHARELANRIEAAYEREMSDKEAAHQQWRDNYRDHLRWRDEEIDRLRAALKDIMGLDIDDHEKLYDALRAVREAQRIMKEGEDNAEARDGM